MLQHHVACMFLVGVKTGVGMRIGRPMSVAAVMFVALAPALSGCKKSGAEATAEPVWH